jgi:lipopolysaccharide transport system permease protein
MISSLSSLWSHRVLMASLARREIDMRYRGTFGGVFWYVLNNLATLSLFTFVFGVALEVRWPGSTGTTGDFALRLFTGLIVFNFVSECLTRAPALIVSQPNFVKKVVFPLEILPIVVILATLFNTLIAFGVLLTGMLVMGASFTPTLLLAPLVILSLLPLVLGLCWFLAALGVYVRDIGQVMPLLTTALVFLSPVFFPVSTLPVQMQDWIALNPISVPVHAARDLVINGVLPDFTALGLLFGAGLIAAALGLSWFRLTKRGFADVL